MLCTLRCAALVGALLLRLVAAAQTENLWTAVDRLVRAHMDTSSIVGLSVAIARADTVLLAKGYGWQAMDSAHAVNAHTGFLLSSVTKLFTSTAVMQLVEQGRLALNDRVVNLLPELQWKDKRFEQVTIEHLLTHSSGLPWDHELKNAPHDTTALAALVRSMINVKLQFAPGEKFSGDTYSNAGYDLLGHIVERVSGLGYTHYVEEHILRVVGMTDAAFERAGIVQNLASPHAVAGTGRAIQQLNLYGIDDVKQRIRNGRPLPLKVIAPLTRYAAHYPSGYLTGSASDLGNWMAHLLRIATDSTFTPPMAVLNHRMLDSMWATQRTIEGKLTAMGLCWWNYTDPVLGRYVFHVGRDPGYCSILLILPDQHIGVAVCANGMYADNTLWNKLGPGIAGLVKEAGLKP